MSVVPAKQQADQQPRPFAFRCSTVVFPPEEIEALSDCGNWMEALAAGVMEPATPEQSHFLQVDREEAEPSTIGERAWVRLKGRREYERDQERAAPPPPEDYGIVQWDLDRCWW